MRLRRVMASGALGVLLLGLAGCDLWVPQERNAETSDGVSGRVGTVFVGNAVLIAAGDEANLVMSLVNRESHDIRFRISYGTPQVTQTIRVPANSLAHSGVTQIGPQGDQQVILTDFNAMPGSLYPVYFQYGDATILRLTVPVLNDALEQYRHLNPPPTTGRH
jgi:hypothetical protein